MMHYIQAGVISSPRPRLAESSHCSSHPSLGLCCSTLSTISPFSCHPPSDPPPSPSFCLFDDTRHRGSGNTLDHAVGSFVVSGASFSSAGRLFQLM